MTQNLAKKTNQKLNLRSLDALRGFLSVYVLIGHCRWLLWAGNSEWNKLSHNWFSSILANSSAIFRYGHEAVMIFFVLSGFFIHLRIAKQLAENGTFKFDIKRFFHRRLHRLVPPYVFALILTLIVDLIGRHFYPTLYNAATGDSLLDLNFANKDFSLNAVIPALFLIPSSLGKDFGTNGAFWSLGYEFIYYLLYPLWLLVRRVNFLFSYLLVIGLAISSIWLIPSGFLHGIIVHYPLWLVGAFIAEILIKKQLPNKVKFASYILLPIAFIAINLNSPELPSLFWNTLLGSSTLLFVISLPSSVFKTFWHQFFEFLGIESYTIYICHFPLVAFVSAWTIETFGERPMHGWLAIFTSIVILLICHLFFILCERNFMHKRLKI